MKNDAHNKIAIAIADDHEIFRMGMKKLIDDMPNTKLIFESQNGKDLIDKIKGNIPDIIFMDINMPILNGIETTETIRRQYPSIKIIALTASKEPLYFKEMVRIGIQGFMSKTASQNDITTAINQVYNGITYISNDLFDLISETILNKDDNHSLFTQREFEILELICSGMDTHDIAKKLFLSHRTIEKHKSNMLEKSHTRNTAQLVIYAIKNKLITLH